MSSARQNAPKKRYDKPQLKIYGDIEGLTASVSFTTSNNDGGMFGTMTKTH